MLYTKISKYYYILAVIFAIGLFFRFINFKQSIYFGYDEARDAFDSQNIYLKGDLKISGPPASAFAGINHGPFYLYFIGPLFILDGGYPYLASAVFRIINALGIILIYYLVDYYFGKPRGLIAALIYAISFEESQYAMFTGNPALAIPFWILMFIGAGLVYRKKQIKFGLFLMFFSASMAAQVDMILGFSFLTTLALLFFMRSKLTKIRKSSWFKILFFGLMPVYSYLVAEIVNKFLGLKTLLQVTTNASSILPVGETAFSIAFKNFGGLFADNIVNFTNIYISTLSAFAITGYLLYKARKNRLYLFIAIWCLSLFALMITRGFMPLYSYAGVGVGMIVGMSLILYEISKKSKILFVLTISIITLGNLNRIVDQSQKGLVVEIKAQPGMLLSQEEQIIKNSYEFSNYQGFTIRTTTMPYKIQTVWAYLYNQFGKLQFGYLPYNEYGNTLGYPGFLPVPIRGTTCSRVLIQEPTRGIPQHLINKDVEEENLFSKVVKVEKIGEYIIQYRTSKDNNCHNIKPV